MADIQIPKAGNNAKPGKFKSLLRNSSSSLMAASALVVASSLISLEEVKAQPIITGFESIAVKNNTIKFTLPTNVNQQDLYTVIANTNLNFNTIEGAWFPAVGGLQAQFVPNIQATNGTYSIPKPQGSQNFFALMDFDEYIYNVLLATAWNGSASASFMNITSPQANTTVNGTINLSGVVIDPFEPLEVDFWALGPGYMFPIGGVTNGQISCTFDTRQLSDGPGQIAMVEWSEFALVNNFAPNVAFLNLSSLNYAAIGLNDIFGFKSLTINVANPKTTNQQANLQFTMPSYLNPYESYVAAARTNFAPSCTFENIYFEPIDQSSTNLGFYPYLSATNWVYTIPMPTNSANFFILVDSYRYVMNASYDITNSAIINMVSPLENSVVSGTNVSAFGYVIDACPPLEVDWYIDGVPYATITNGYLGVTFDSTVLSNDVPHEIDMVYSSTFPDVNGAAALSYVSITNLWVSNSVPMIKEMPDFMDPNSSTRQSRTIPFVPPKKIAPHPSTLLRGAKR